MDLPLTLQYLLIALAVLASAVVTMHKQFPGPTRRLRIACALPLLREGRQGWVRGLGRFIAPDAGGTAAGCSAACGGCEPKT